MQAAESEAEKLALQERIDQLLRAQQDLESRATSLQLTVDRLTLALAKTEEEEQMSKEKLNELSESLNDSNATSQTLQERLQQLQRALTNSEHDRRIMQERLEALKSAQQDAKTRNNMLQDRLQQMKNEQADAEVRLIGALLGKGGGGIFHCLYRNFDLTDFYKSEDSSASSFNPLAPSRPLPLSPTTGTALGSKYTLKLLTPCMRSFSVVASTFVVEREGKLREQEGNCTTINSPAS